MHAIPEDPGFLPGWRAASEQRLRISMLVSTVALAAALSLIRMPSPAEVAPLLELVVELVRPAPMVEPEVLPAPPEAVPVEEAVAPPAVPQARTESIPADDAAATNDEAVDWEVAREEAIREVLDAAEKEQAYAVNPPFERARQEAAVRFRASVAPEERHVWDNVEKDQLGRTILRDGNCFRVLNDPSAVNRWAFENFDQFVVYCDFTFGRREGKEMPWVDIIRERYPYLRDPVAIP
jgi:hypothetical protein